MEPIIIGIGFLVILIIAYMHLQSEKQVNQIKFENIEKNQNKQDKKIEELKQEKRELEKKLENVKGEVIGHKTDYLVNQEATRAKFDSVDETTDRLDLKLSKTNTKLNQHKIETQISEKQHAERFYQQGAQLQVTQATTKTAIEFIGNDITALRGDLHDTNHNLNQHKINFNNYQVQNEQRFNNHESQFQVQQAESRTAITYIGQGISKLQGDVQSTNQRVDQQQTEFSNARVQFADQINQVGQQIENTKQASRSAIQSIDSKLAILQEQTNDKNLFVDLLEVVNPINMIKAITNSSKEKKK